MTEALIPLREIAAMDAATDTGRERIGVEVFEAEDLDALTGRCEAFFGLMPSLAE